MHCVNLMFRILKLSLDYEQEPQLEEFALVKLDTAGLDKIPPKLIKDSGSVITPYPNHIFYQSQLVGIFPNNWKKLNSLRYLNLEIERRVKNDRPISILSAVSKIFEKIEFEHFKC